MSCDAPSVSVVCQMLWPDHCIAHSSGAAFHPSLLVHLKPSSKVQQVNQESNDDQSKKNKKSMKYFDIVIQKGTNQDIDAYSAFNDNAQAAPTVLAKKLRKRGV